VLRAVVIAAVKPRFYRKVLIDTGIRPAWNWARGAVTAVQRDGILYVGGDQGPPEAHTGYLEEAQGPTNHGAAPAGERGRGGRVARRTAAAVLQGEHRRRWDTGL